MKTYFFEMAKILVVGLNPAWQQILVVPVLQTGEVNRATESYALAGGKGMNAAKILAQRGHDVSLLHVLAGTNGDRMLDACTALGILSLHVFSEGETRAAVTLIHNDTATEIIEPFSASGEDLEESILDSVLMDIEYDALLVCGTLPAGLSKDLYGQLLRRITCKKIFWDSVVPFDEETASRITWLKVNASEYKTLEPILDKFGANPSLLITDGPAKASVHTSAGNANCVLPKLEAIVSPIGAGDTVTATLVDGVLSGLDVQNAVTMALACGMASCLSPLPAVWKPSDANSLKKEIAWEA